MSEKGKRVPARLSAEASLEFQLLVRRWLEERYPWRRTAKGGKRADEGRANISRAVRDLTGGKDENIRKLFQRLCYVTDTAGVLLDVRVTDKTVDRVTKLFATKDSEFPKEVSKALWSTDARREFGRVTAGQDSDWAATASPVELGAMLREPDEPWALTWGRGLPVVRQEPRAWDELEGFRLWAETKGHDKWLVLQSLRRILGPLVAHYRTGGLMPGWGDLNAGARVRFIKSGVVREKLMLGQKPLHVRAVDRWPVGADPAEDEHTIP